jgi:hypothetical protein
MKQKQKSKNFLILGLFLFGITLLLWNCTVEDNVIETENIDLSNVKTVSFKDAIANFNAKKEKITLKRTYSKGTKNQLEITPDWNTLEFNDIAYTDAKLTTANTEINRDGKYSSQLYFINVNNHIRNVIFTIYKDKMDDNGNVINGRIFFNDLNGKFLDGYIIEKGVFTKRYIIQKRNQTQKASFLPLFLFQTESDGIDYSCWVYSGGELDEVVVTAYLQESDESGGGGSGNDGGVYYTYGNSYGSYINGATSDGMNTNVGGGTSLSSGQITSAAGAILMATPIEPDENGNCPDGYKKNPTTGKCESVCTGGKFYNETSQKCECPEGLNEDDNGNCVNKPCKGNPIKGKLEVAPQKGKSKTKGALQGCTRYGVTCTGGTDGINKPHAGIDIKSSYGNPIYAMYDGFIFSTKNDSDGAGYYTRIQSTANGKTFIHEYFHLQKENRVLQGNPLVKVKAGDIIGYQGDSGNLKDAIKKKTVDSHVHIEIREHDGSNKWGYANFTPIDPRTYFSTTIKDDGTSEPNTNCN